MAWWLHFVDCYFFRRVGLALGLAPRDREVGRLPVFAAFAGFAAAALGAAAGAAPCCCAHSPAAATTHTAATPLASPSLLGSAGSSRSR